MPHPIEIFVIIAYYDTIFLWRYNYLNAVFKCFADIMIRIIPYVSEQILICHPIYQGRGLSTICCGTCCDKKSDWHTMRIHGQMYFAVEPPFVLSIP